MTSTKKHLKNTLLNKLAIESPDDKFVDVTLKDGSKGLTYSPCTLMSMPLSMEKHKMKTKYTTTQKVNYRQEDEIINKPLSCTDLYAMNTKPIRMVQLIYPNQSEILAYNIDDKIIYTQTSSLTRIWHSIPTSRYVITEST